MEDEEENKFSSLLTSPLRRLYDPEDDFFILGNLWRGMWNQRILLENPNRYSLSLFLSLSKQKDL